MQMAMSTSGSGHRIKQTVKELIFPNVVPNMSETGLKTNRMEKDKKHGLMKQFILEIIKTGRSMEKVNLCGEMIVLTKGISMKILFTDLVGMNGKMEEFMRVNGKITECMERELSLGPMEENM
jgi:hypothetical protein